MDGVNQYKCLKFEVPKMPKVKGIFSINRGKSSAVPFFWIPAFAGMTDTYSISSFPRKRESPAAAGLTLLIEMLQLKVLFDILK